MSGPLPVALRPVAGIAARLYAAAVGWRNRRFDRGRGVERVPVPVISIGNLTAGGTGKTPIVQWTAQQLIAAGRQPAIALRGYAAGPDRSKSDEAAEHAEAVSAATILVNPDRVSAVRDALAAGSTVDAVVLDDGFQHRRLARDLDVVLIDARAATLDDRVLPAGWLREPISGLRRADAVVITHADAVDPALAEAVRACSGHEPVAWTRHRWSGLRRWDVGAAPTVDAAALEPVSWLEGRSIGVMAGIARPAGVSAMAVAAGARVVHEAAVRDHHRHDAAGWSAVSRAARAAGAEALLVTRKDRVKLARLPVSSGADALPLVEPILEIEFIAGEETLARRVTEAIASG